MPPWESGERCGRREGSQCCNCWWCQGGRTCWPLGSALAWRTAAEESVPSNKSKRQAIGKRPRNNRKKGIGNRKIRAATGMELCGPYVVIHRIRAFRAEGPNGSKGTAADRSAAGLWEHHEAAIRRCLAVRTNILICTIPHASLASNQNQAGSGPIMGKA